MQMQVVCVHAPACSLLNYQQQLFPVVERDGLLERYILLFNLSNGSGSLVLVDAIMRIIQHKDSGFSFS